MPSTPRAALLSCVGLAAGAASAQVPGFEIRDGWPLTLGPGPSVDGGMMVNMDADAELELVQIVQDRIHAFNLDGTAVPGWPRVMEPGRGVFGAPAFGDIDGDGQDEVIAHTFLFGIDGSIFAFRKDGSIVPGFPFPAGGLFKAPALGDIDGDGDLEILSVANVGGVAQLFAVQGDGSLAANFPVSLEALSSGASVSVGDIDNDGRPEIVVPSFTRLHAFEADGTPMPGFPFLPDDGGEPQTINYSSVGLADFDGDGDRELVLATTNEFEPFTGRVYVLEHTGDVRDGWPRSLEFSIFVPPTIADVDGDGLLDVAIGDRTLSPTPLATVTVWDRDGNTLPGWPVTGVVGAVHAQIMVADIDGDARVELLVDDNTAVTPLFAFNHDGTQVDGWPLPLGTGSSFQQSPTIGDFDGDGFLDISASGNDLVRNRTLLFQLASDAVPFDPALAPARTYQYDSRRSGVADPDDATGCPADIDGDGELTLFDFLAFQNAFDAGTPLADFDGDGELTLFDFLAFQNAFDAGCP
ncbi:MAG: FG-GAP-like repeat-containing protein [Planctomycetota bacterium]